MKANAAILCRALRPQNALCGGARSHAAPDALFAR